MVVTGNCIRKCLQYGNPYPNTCSYSTGTV